MFRAANMFVFCLKLYAWPYMIIYFFLRMCMYTIYMLIEGYDKWWLGFIPGGHYVFKWEVGKVSPALLLLTLIAECATIYFPILPFAALWWLFASIVNYKFAKKFAANYPAAVYGFVPCGLFVYFVKEIIAWKNSIKESSTMNMA